MNAGQKCIAIVVASSIMAFSCGSTILAQTFTSANRDDAGTWNTVYAQGFRPSLNASPDPGLPAGDSVFLNQLDFYKSGEADSASNIQLAIVDNMFYDYSVQLTTSSSSFVGISANTIAGTAPLATGDPITFSFPNLPLEYGSDYAAVFVNDDGSGNLTPVLVSALTENYTESPPGSGVFVPVSNYGGDSEFQYATSNFINNGFFNTFAFAGDAAFEATFSVVPEPASGVLAFVGVVILLARRRKMSLSY